MIGGNQLNPDQIPTQKNSAAGPIAGQLYYDSLNLGGMKVVVLYFDDYENDTTTNQVIDFPIPFVNPPTVIIGNSTLPTMTATATELTIVSPDSTTLYSGAATIIGI